MVYRGPYEYSVPGARQGLHAAVRAERPDPRWTFRTPSKTGPTPGLTNGKLGIWLFLASEVMLFGALFSTYI